MRSLIAHTKMKEGLLTEIDIETKLLAIGRTIADFSAAEYKLPEDFLEYTHFERVLSQLDMASSPGYPYLLQYATNGDMLGCKQGVIDESRKAMVWRLVTDRIIEKTTDPIRLFVKPEPHKVTKIKSHRYRLISSVSLIDQIIDHMLFGSMNQKMIDNYIDLPSKVGWSPYVGGWKIVPAGRMFATDKSAWDWTVQGWLVEAEFSVRCGLMRRDINYEYWRDLASWRYSVLYRDALFVTSNGLLLRQKWPGVVKSGCVNTIATNSIMQVILHHVVCSNMGEHPRPIWSMGDDTLQYPQEDMEKYCQYLGQYCKLKEYQQVTEFAGNRFSPGGKVDPLYFGKHCYNLLHVDPEVAHQLGFSYMLLYHRSSRRWIIERILSEITVVPPVEFLDMVFDGE